LFCLARQLNQQLTAGNNGCCHFVRQKYGIDAAAIARYRRGSGGRCVSERLCSPGSTAGKPRQDWAVPIARPSLGLRRDARPRKGLRYARWHTLKGAIFRARHFQGGVGTQLREFRGRHRPPSPGEKITRRGGSAVRWGKRSFPRVGTKPGLPAAPMLQVGLWAGPRPPPTWGVRHTGASIMSAMPRIALENCAAQRKYLCANCGLMHRSKNTPLLDHLVGAQHNRWGYTKRLGGLEVHHLPAATGRRVGSGAAAGRLDCGQTATRAASLIWSHGGDHKTFRTPRS
jgi:hypothetical protein